MTGNTGNAGRDGKTGKTGKTGNAGNTGNAGKTGGGGQGPDRASYYWKRLFKNNFVSIRVDSWVSGLLFLTTNQHELTRRRRRGSMGTETHVTPGKDSNYINYQRFTSGVLPGAYIRVGGWGTNLYHWYPPVVRARVNCMRL